MEKRPDFHSIKSYEEFISYYWYREELSALCKQLKLDPTGTKQELNHTIKEYFKGNLITKQNTNKHHLSVSKITLNTPLLDCGFAFNDEFRAYFSKQTGAEKFKFTADMAAAWRKVKKEQDKTFTIRDMLEVYHHKSAYAKYDASACEWNQFLKDFCTDIRNAVYRNKLKAAAVLWKIVRTSLMPKVYTYELVEKHQHLLQEFM